ncbi:uncharacterized protein [Bemisia tabaci]|uniref:uncharacterized protein n=1 Tax=Bemisia tabaci TaxID=7038 RepID=UPI003B27D8E0
MNIIVIRKFRHHQLYVFHNASVIPSICSSFPPRSARDSYSNKAIGYVQVKREIPTDTNDKTIPWLCHVKADMTPEHKVRIKPYPVHCLIDERRMNILKTICEDCPASEDGCKHVVAFVCWLHRQSETPARTSVECYWRNSTLSKVGGSMKALRIEEIHPPSTVTLSEEVKKEFFNASIEALRKCSPSILRSHCEEQSTYALFHFMLKYVQTPEPHSPDGFIEFCENSMTDAECEALVAASAGQSKSSLWFEVRQGRVTGSNIHQASRSSGGISLVNLILGAVPFKETKAMKRGSDLEPIVLNAVQKRFKNEKMSRGGVILKRKHPIFGASPDAYLGKYIVEVKCPMSKKTYKRYFDKSGEKPAKKFRGQMQLQMFMSDYRETLFCVADPSFSKSNNSPRLVKIVREQFDPIFCDNMMSLARKFWDAHIYPRLYAAVKM